MRFRSIAVFLLALAVAAGVLDRWRRSRGGEAHEASIVLAPAHDPALSRPPSPAAAPTSAEVQPALDRVFDGILTVDQARDAFLTGDFNGDGISDLAVAVRPRNREDLPRLATEMGRWSVQDATAGSAGTISRPEPVTLATADLLLAVIHGVDGGAWRDPEARQGFVVKNAVGSGLRLRPLAGLPPAIRMKATRVHAGDVIVQSRGGKPGLVLWTGAAYVWADL